MTLTEARSLVAKVPHWHHTFDIFPGVVTPGSYDPKFLLDMIGLPADLSGARVLDVGASDGFFSVRLAQRGADVLAVDYRNKEEHGFYVAEMLNSDLRLQYRRMNVYDISPQTVGHFDIILFLGVLYHVPDMIKALYSLRECCRGSLFVETHSENDFCPTISAARYYREATLANDHTNFWAPNRLCVLDMLHDTSFDVLRDEAWGQRLFVEARTSSAEGLRRQKMRLGYGLFGT